jgi:hypothetical protein
LNPSASSGQAKESSKEKSPVRRFSIQVNCYLTGGRVVPATIEKAFIFEMHSPQLLIPENDLDTFDMESFCEIRIQEINKIKLTKFAKSYFHFPFHC